MVRIGVVGAGYWGPNLMRNFAACPLTSLAAVCDQDAARLQKFRRLYPGAALVPSLDDLLGLPGVDAVALATPVQTHYPLAAAALRAGKHVLVEKPLAASAREAEDLVRLARERGRVLMVDHTYLFSPAVRHLKALIDSGEVGDLYFIDSVRINLGLFQHDTNVVWDLAPHDLSITQYLLGTPPREVVAFGSCHADAAGGIEDLAYVHLDYGGGLLAAFHLSWLSPVKVRQFILGGSKKSVVFNDLEPAEKLKVYDRGFTVKTEDQRRRVQIGYRMGSVVSPHLEQGEPLQAMVQHFARCVQSGAEPASGGEFGLGIVRILERAQVSIKSAGPRVAFGGAADDPPRRAAA
jgi:predicted dehydrogenase